MGVLKDSTRYVAKYALKPGGIINLAEEAASKEQLGWQEKAILFPAVYFVEIMKITGYGMIYNVGKNVINHLSLIPLMCYNILGRSVLIF